MRKLAAVVAAVAVVVGLASTPTAQGVVAKPEVSSQPSARQGYTPPPISWHSCADPTLQAFGARCGRVIVPLNYAYPHGKKIKLAVSRVLHTTSDADYQGVMLVNPGGPGGSGLIFSIFQTFVPKHAGESYDWIGFDPRGVGSSEPSLGCDGHYFGYNRPNYVPKTRHLMKVWLKRSKHYARACKNAGASRLLGHIKTTDNVKDMESIRKALGAAQINYYGFSYGTYLGSVYATKHPNRVRRFVFDGNVNPRDVWYAANLNQDVAFEKVINIYFRWLAKYHKVYHVGRTGKSVRHGFFRQLNKLDRHPAGGVVGSDELTDVFLTAGYFTGSWEGIAQAYAAWVNHHRSKPLRELFRNANPVGPKADNLYSIYLGTGCTDARWPQSQARLNRDSRRLDKRYPFFSWPNAWFNGPCPYWHAKAGHPVNVSGAKVKVPILLINETFDAATPFPGALEMRHLFRRASLIEGVNGTTHAGSLSGVRCVDNRIANYLIDGRVPVRKPGRRSDVRCPHVPRPDPTAKQSGRLSERALALAKLRDVLMRAQRHY